MAKCAREEGRIKTKYHRIVKRKRRVLKIVLDG
jgi:hypothetical protein